MICIHLAKGFEQGIMLFWCHRLLETGNKTVLVWVNTRRKPKCASGEIIIPKRTTMFKGAPSEQVHDAREVGQKIARFRIKPTHERVCRKPKSKSA